MTDFPISDLGPHLAAAEEAVQALMEPCCSACHMEQNDPRRIMSEYQLGQRVRFTTNLRRGWGMESDNRGGTKEWKPQPILGKLTPPREGIIVGRRTLSNGRFDYGSYDDPGVYRPREHFTAYMIVTDLRSAPVHVLPEHITPLEES